MTVAGQSSGFGLDELVFPSIPEIDRVSGCTDDGHATYSCSTAGGTKITISGSDLRAGMTVDVGGKACTEVEEPTDGVLTCELPAGTGQSLLISVSLTIVNGDGETTDTLTSAAVYLIGYAVPSVLTISHQSCADDKDSLFLLSECPRAGGGTLIVTGANLGTEGAVVLIGSEVCDKLTHITSEEVHCELPAGM